MALVFFLLIVCRVVIPTILPNSLLFCSFLLFLLSVFAVRYLFFSFLFSFLSFSFFFKCLYSYLIFLFYFYFFFIFFITYSLLHRRYFHYVKKHPKLRLSLVRMPASQEH